MPSGAKIVRFERAEDELGMYHLRDELDYQYNANNTGDDTLYFPDQRGKLSGSGCNGLHTI